MLVSVLKSGVFLWNLRNFYEHLFWTTSVNDCFCSCCGKFLKFKGFTYNGSRFYSTWSLTKKRPHRGCFCLNFEKIVSAAFERTFLGYCFLIETPWRSLFEGLMIRFMYSFPVQKNDIEMRYSYLSNSLK